MTENERYELEKAARMLDSWLHNGKTEKPRQTLLDAMTTAMKLMEQADSVRAVRIHKRTCAVLNYHVVNPMAVMFRDPVTISAVKEAITVLENALGWRHI